MIGRLLDKLTFGAALIIALQAPQLTDHYQQFLSGLYESTKWQVEGYQATAQQYQYPSAKAMIEHHLRNETPSVRADAQQKITTLNLFDELKMGMGIFESGSIVNKAIYMFHPARYDHLKATLENFTPGIPLTINGLIFGVILGLILNLLITLPFTVWAKRKTFLKPSKHPTGS